MITEGLKALLFLTFSCLAVPFRILAGHVDFHFEADPGAKLDFPILVRLGSRHPLPRMAEMVRYFSTMGNKNLVTHYPIGKTIIKRNI